MAVFEHPSYREFLRSQLVERLSKNPRYSLRAMARDLGIQPSHLSMIHSGKTNLSNANAVRVAEKLGLKHDEVEYFCLLVEMESTSSPSRKGHLIEKINALRGAAEPVRDLTVDIFRLISDWYHLPILELTRCKGFKLSAPRAASKLGITVHEAKMAIDRLKRCELLVEDSDGNLVKSDTHLQIASSIPNSALRSFHRQMLQKAMDSLEEQGPQERYVGSETLAFSPEELPAVHQLIGKFRKEFVRKIASYPNRSEIYHLGVQFFRVSRKKKKEILRRSKV